MTPVLSKPYYRSELDLLPTKSTNPETTNWRCLMASEGNGFTHYLVSKEVVLGEACILEPCNEWISLAFIKLGIDRPEAVIPRAFDSELDECKRDPLVARSEEHTSELQSLRHLVCRLLLEKKKTQKR